MPADDAATASPRTRRTTLIAQVYLRDALETIDAELGEGAARKNPALVVAYLQACATIHARPPAR